MDKIGKQFQKSSFKSTAKTVSNNLRQQRGMPLDAKINLINENSNYNIEQGGTETSVKVSVIHGGSPDRGEDLTHIDALSGLSRSKYGSGLGTTNDGLQYRTNQQSR
jgi:hypothetical protein